jgi:thermostable 8-oxoguanine DNA glycosylase
MDRRQIEFLKAVKERYLPATQRYIRPEGWWKRASPEKLWTELVGQICVIGRSGPWDSLKQSTDIKGVSLASLGQVYENEGRKGLVRHVHAILAKYGIRFVSRNRTSSQKAERIAGAFLNPDVVKNGEFVLMKTLEDAPDARDALRAAVRGIGLKSASDYLTEIGFSRDYIALDVRAMTILKKWQKRGLFQDLTIDYKQIEERLRKVATEAGLSLGELDRIIYRNYSDLKEV